LKVIGVPLRSKPPKMSATMTPRIRNTVLSLLAQRPALVRSQVPATACLLRCTPRTFSTSPSRLQELGQQPQQPTTPPEPAAAATAAPKPGSRRGRRLISAAVFLLIGTAAGSSLRLVISPPDPPVPDTEEDSYTISVLHTQASHLPIVKQLEADPAWDSWDAYQTLTPEHKAQHITAGALRGSRGVGGYQRVFYNASTGEFISVVYFGGGTTGWPGVVHGGVLATILDESCGRAAFRQWGGLSGVTANLTVEYKKASLSNGFYVVRVKPRPEEDLPESERGKRHYKSYLDATIEDAVTGHLTVKCSALFVGGQRKEKKSSGWRGGKPAPKLEVAGKEENLKF